ncbi:DUF930 domain-containing protein [Mesorhizobium sp. M0276]|uniref:DUF930 domain-containing protein n=1 Tax=Mesorhizobium sp. M0276 TaxID=2956928 RepID=UPI00333695A0
MNGKTGERRHLLWGLPASMILHALIAALLVYNVPKAPEQPQQEQAVNVALVPPPDQPKPKPQPKEPKAEKLPEPKAEKPLEQKIEKSTPAEKQPPKPSPIEVLKPVFQFGDRDSGPRKSLDGASAQDNSPSPAKDEQPKPAAVPKQTDDKVTASAGPAEPAAKEIEPTQEKQPASAKDVDKQQADKQEPEADDNGKQAAASPTPLAASGGDDEIELPTSAETPKPKPTNAPKPELPKVSKSASESASRPSSADVAAASRRYSGLPGVRKLYSQGATGDASATSSMAGVPRGKRAAKLCASALQQQLLDASYFPELIPSVPLKAGNILDAPDVAFRTTTTWYHLGFRCEVDTNATRVLSFNFRVGPVIPADQWVRLGLPVR